MAATGTDPEHHGYLTVEAAARPEISAPGHRRVFGMTITARDNRDRGRPSAWSSALDALAADCGRTWRPSAANRGIRRQRRATPQRGRNYPESNDSDGVHDPAQAWNVLTVGACTDLVSTTEPDTEALEANRPEGWSESLLAPHLCRGRGTGQSSRTW